MASLPERLRLAYDGQLCTDSRRAATLEASEALTEIRELAERLIRTPGAAVSFSAAVKIRALIERQG